MKIVTACLTATPLLAALCLATPSAHADDDKDSPLRIEFGGATEWSIDDHNSQSGPSIGLEFEGFQDYEIEVGTAPLRSDGHTEWNTDFIIKKEYALSPAFEFEAGLGPEWNYSTGKNSSSTAGVEIEAEFIYWTSPSHRFGWYLEPGYGYDLGKDHEQSLDIGLGLTVAVP